jgi:outer membrane immunogenic protein
MKKVWVTVAGLIAAGIAGPAWAADMPVKMPVKAPPPPPPIYDWTGFYIGANGGWAQARNCWDFVDIFGTTFTDACNDRSGGVVGGQIGYRWQAGGAVFGLEAQGDWADLSRTRVSLVDPFFSVNVKTDAIGLFTGQIGYAWNAALLYVKGGGAVVGNRFRVLETATGASLATADETRWGATVGVGFEYGFAPNWSIGAEYDHLFLGHGNNSLSFVDPFFSSAINRNRDIDMATLRINYRFGGFGSGFGGPGAPPRY